MNGTNRPNKILRWIPAVLAIIVGGYLLLSLLGTLLGLAFAGGIVMGGFWMLRYFLNRWNDGKTLQIPVETPVMDDGNLDLELEELKKNNRETNR